jgi:alpha/beta superfamily hydrolase
MLVFRRLIAKRATQTPRAAAAVVCASAHFQATPSLSPMPSSSAFLPSIKPLLARTFVAAASTAKASRRRVDFVGSKGEKLSGVVEAPDTTSFPKPKAYALFAHCFTCGKDSHAASRIAKALTADGIVVLRFDFTGLGSSDGDFANTSFSSNIGDLVAAAEFMSGDVDLGAPTLLIGHSLGGTAVVAAAASIPSAKAVVTLGSPSTPEHVVHQFDAADVAVIERDGEMVRFFMLRLFS